MLKLQKKYKGIEKKNIRRYRHQEIQEERIAVRSVHLIKGIKT